MGILRFFAICVLMVRRPSRPISADSAHGKMHAEHKVGCSEVEVEVECWDLYAHE
jgi:hypothetical protein